MQNTGTLVTAAVRPNDTLDKIASAYAVEIKGGMHSYATLSDRDNLIVERREWGMLVNVYNDGANNGTYQLVYNRVNTNITNNSNWARLSLGTDANGQSIGSAYWIDPVISFESTEPSPSNGDRYIIEGVPTGANWAGIFVEGDVVTWDSSLSSWRKTTPLDGMSLRVSDENNAIYRWESGLTKWVKEKLNQVLSVTASSANAIDYTTTDSRVFSYDVDTLYMVKFGTVNSGQTVTLDINGLGTKTVKQQTNAGLIPLSGKDINIELSYPLSYDGTDFRLTKPNIDPSYVRYRILSNETIVVPAWQEYLLYGDLEVNGHLNIDPDGKVVIINGVLNINGGTVSNSHRVFLIELGLGLSVRKKSFVVSLTANTPESIVHNFNSPDVTITAWDEATSETILLSVVRVSVNEITVESTQTLASVRVVVVS